MRVVGTSCVHVNLKNKRADQPWVNSRIVKHRARNVCIARCYPVKKSFMFLTTRVTDCCTADCARRAEPVLP